MFQLQKNMWKKIINAHIDNNVDMTAEHKIIRERRVNITLINKILGKVRDGSHILSSRLTNTKIL